MSYGQIIVLAGIGVVAFIVAVIAGHGWVQRRRDRKMGRRKTDRIKL